MFYTSISRKKPTKTENYPVSEVRYVGVPQQYVDASCYYQIYENGHSLANMHFASISDARARLRALHGELKLASSNWYRVERKLPSIPVRNILGLRKVYGDGSAVEMTYVIRKVDLKFS